MAGTFSLAFRGTFDDLINMIDVNRLLLCYLQEYNVLEPSQIKSLELIPEAVVRTFTLLELLERRQDSLFEKFIDALNKSKQTKVVEFLMLKNKKAYWVERCTGQKNYAFNPVE